MSTNIFTDCLDEPVEAVPTGTKVPNKFPSLNNQPYRIAIIGDYPTKDDELQQTPFVGMQGKLLTGLLSKAKIIREACFLGTINETLTEDLQKFNPHICLLLGDAIASAKSGVKLDNYRGSLFVSDVVGPFLGRKCIASFHPSRIFKQYDCIPYLWFDILKALANSTSPELNLPQRELIINLTAQEIVEELSSLKEVEIGTDLEGYWNYLRCISVAESSTRSFIVPFQKMDGSSYWSTEDDEFIVWEALIRVLTNSKIPKLWQNGLYDRFVFQYGHNICIQGNYDDSMIAWWEKFCELEKGLAVQASILTNEPWYKGEIKSSSIEEFFTYCCKDSAITKEVKEKTLAKLTPAQLNHYQLNIALLNPILYMELRGIKYDKESAEKRLEEINGHIYSLQAKLDALAGVGIGHANKVGMDNDRKKSIFDSFGETPQPGTPADNLRTSLKIRVQQTCCQKRNQELPKKDYQESYYKVMAILNNSSVELTEKEIGYINTVCGWSMNVKSKAYKDLLYEKLKLPKQYNTDSYGKKSLTTDNDALLNLQKKVKTPEVELGINIMELRTRSQMLEITADPDGRTRCGYNIVGTVTGRISCYTSPTGSGYAMQTIPDSYTGLPEGHPLRQGMRDLFIADKDHTMFQCDLKGSDGWTIGAWLYRLGDPSMLHDLRNGIKPASRICYMLRHGNTSLYRKDTEEVKELLKEIKKDDWDYFAMKIGIWGQCYLMGPDLLNAEILSESYGRMSMSRSEIKDFQNATFTAYDVRRWHKHMENHLERNPTLYTIDGHTRRFWSRPQDRLGKALAHEPQMVTTHATKLALYKMWTDPQNRIENNMLKAEPLHTVHDSLLGQTKQERTWLEERLEHWFDNEITVAGLKIKIPYSFEWGTNWSFK